MKWLKSYVRVPRKCQHRLKRNLYFIKEAQREELTRSLCRSIVLNDLNELQTKNTAKLQLIVAIGDEQHGGNFCITAIHQINCGTKVSLGSTTSGCLRRKYLKIQFDIGLRSRGCLSIWHLLWCPVLWKIDCNIDWHALWNNLVAQMARPANWLCSQNLIYLL